MGYPLVTSGQVIKPVTSILTARMNEPSQFLYDKIMPKVPNITADIGEIFALGTDHNRSYSSERGVWDESQHRIEFRYTRGNFYNLKYYDLEILLPDQLYKNFESPLDIERDAGETLMHSLRVQRELAVATALRDVTVLTNNTTLTGGDQWNNYGTSTPAQDIKDIIKARRTATGLQMNSIIIPRPVLDDLKFHPDFTDQVVNLTIMTDEMIVELLKKNFGFKNVFVGETTYLSSQEGQTEAYSDIWGKDVVIFYIPESVSLFNRSLGYTFELKGQPIRVTRYRHPNDVGNNIRTAMSFDQKILDTSLAYLIVNATA